MKSKVNFNISLVRPMNRQLNCLRWGSNETDNHINTKLEVCKCLKKQGFQFITESIFISGKRADVFDLENGIAYEIYESETELSLFKKSSDYPVQVIFVDAKCPKNDIKKIMGLL